MSYRLYSKAGVLQRKSAFNRSATVSVAVQKIGGNFSHPIGRVRGIATNSSSYSSKGMTSPSLGVFIGRNPMW